MVLQEVIQRLIKELEEFSTASIVPVHQPSKKSGDEGAQDDEPTTRERMPEGGS